MKIKLLLLAVLFSATGGAAIGQPKVIAHRGYWKCENSAQNSISSLRNSIRIEAYGSEFDVLLTSDDIPVVAHGPRHNGMIVEQTPYAELKKSTLSNGESLPTLEAFLKAAKPLHRSRLILEIKSLSSPERETRSVQEILCLVKKAGVCRKTEYIAFSRHVAEEILRLHRRAKVAYLSGDLPPEMLKAMGCTGLDYHYSVFQKRPGWIKEAHDLGMTVNVWTVDDEKTMREMVDAGVDFITTNQPLELQTLLQRTKK